MQNAKRRKINTIILSFLKSVGIREKKWREKKRQDFETARIAQLIKVGVSSNRIILDSWLGFETRKTKVWRKERKNKRERERARSRNKTCTLLPCFTYFHQGQALHLIKWHKDKWNKQDKRVTVERPIILFERFWNSEAHFQTILLVLKPLLGNNSNYESAFSKFNPCSFQCTVLML